MDDSQQSQPSPGPTRVTPSPLYSDFDTILTYIDKLHQPGTVIELRVPKGKGQSTFFGLFDDHRKLAVVIAAINDLRKKNVFITLNPVKRRQGVDNKVYVSHADLERSLRATGIPLTARMVEREAVFSDRTTAKRLWKTRMTRDEDISHRCWILVDIDAGQPEGKSSTDAEKADAAETAWDIADDMTKRQIDTMVTDSGNGFHVLIPVDLANDVESKFLVKNILASLAGKYDKVHGKAHVDISVYNASRIVKAAGIVVCKGEATDDRPHRQSWVIASPTEFTAATREQLESLIDGSPLISPVIGDETPVDLAPLKAASSEEVNKRINYVEKYCEWYGLTIVDQLLEEDRITFLVICPNSREHSGEKTAAIFVNKKGRDGQPTIGFSCLHSHCQKKKLTTWRGFQKVCDTIRPDRPFTVGPRWERQAARHRARTEMAAAMKSGEIDLNDLVIVNCSKYVMLKWLLDQGKIPVREFQVKAKELGVSRRKFRLILDEAGFCETQEGNEHFYEPETDPVKIAFRRKRAARERQQLEEERQREREES